MSNVVKIGVKFKKTDNSVYFSSQDARVKFIVQAIIAATGEMGYQRMSADSLRKIVALLEQQNFIDKSKESK